MVKMYSYRVLKDRNWVWELVSPDGLIVRHGVAETHAAATAKAMSSWLEVVNGQRSAEEDPIVRIGH
jgi:hypothetical protein